MIYDWLRRRLSQHVDASAAAKSWHRDWTDVNEDKGATEVEGPDPGALLLRPFQTESVLLVRETLPKENKST
jgi:hypothetical protein